MNPKQLALSFSLVTLAVADAQANPVQDAVRALADGKIHAVLSNPLFIDSIKGQNAAHAKLTQADIDRFDGDRFFPNR